MAADSLKPKSRTPSIPKFIPYPPWGSIRWAIKRLERNIKPVRGNRSPASPTSITLPPSEMVPSLFSLIDWRHSSTEGRGYECTGRSVSQSEMNRKLSPHPGGKYLASRRHGCSKVRVEVMLWCHGDWSIGLGQSPHPKYFHHPAFVTSIYLLSLFQSARYNIQLVRFISWYGETRFITLSQFTIGLLVNSTRFTCSASIHGVSRRNNW
jgi:hypothetical protein